MPLKTIASTEVELDDEGFFAKPVQWSRAMVPELARDEGIEALTEAHWHVIDFMRKEFLEHGTGPSVRALSKTSGVPVKELYRLFPRGPAKVSARLAGIPKPRGCI